MIIATLSRQRKNKGSKYWSYEISYDGDEHDKLFIQLNDCSSLNYSNKKLRS